MNRDELLKLIEAGDLHGLMLTVGRAWVEKYYSGSEASIMVPFGPGRPALDYPLNSPGASSPCRIDPPPSSPE